MIKLFKEKKYKFTKIELEELIRSGLMWACEGLEYHVGTDKENSKSFVMGDTDNLTVILVEALTVGLPSSEDSCTLSAT